MTNENSLAGLRCPQCGNEDRLFITATIRADVTDDGAEPAEGCDMHRDESSLAICPECDRDGPLAEFRAREVRPRDRIAVRAALDLAMGRVEQARTLLLPIRLPVATECCYLTSTLDKLRVLRAGASEATDLPPDPEGKNDERSEWADKAVAAFRDATGTDVEDALPDLLCDLMHWADRAAYTFDAALDRARDHYAAETAAEAV